jgi:ABC-type Zn uptake system ZnuABC Zn-binding protein ZnuA
MRILIVISAWIGLLILSACAAQTSGENPQEEPIRVVATNAMLADITENITGDGIEISTLIPAEADPHTFQPTPRDVATIANSQLLIANGAGLEEWLQEVIDNAGGDRLVVEASEGLEENGVRPDDPHFWLDPILAMHYARQIRDGLAAIDPDRKAEYDDNTEKFITQLEELDKWVREQVALIPEEDRLIVTNHESFGYYADRYGLTIAGTIIPSVSTGSAPSAQQLVALIEEIKTSGVRAIFIESGSNPELAEQLAQEAGILVIVDLRTQPNSPGESYIDMTRYNTRAIVEALK